MKAWIGIDPGLEGACGIIQEDGQTLICDYHPELIGGLADRLAGLDVTAAVEKPFTLPQQSSSSGLKQGYNAGLWVGALRALRVPFIEVRPQEWKKGLGLPADRKKSKAAACEMCSRLWPDECFYTPRGRILDGRADAMLVARWCKQQSTI